MNPISDTLVAIFERHPLAFVLWVQFGLLPLLIPLVVAFARRPRLQQKARFVFSACARIVGYPAVLTILLVVPWASFQVFLSHVAYEAYPSARTLLSAASEFSGWCLRHWYYVVPLLWPVWVLVASVYAARRWHALAVRS